MTTTQHTAPIATEILDLVQRELAGYPNPQMRGKENGFRGYDLTAPGRIVRIAMDDTDVCVYVFTATRNNEPGVLEGEARFRHMPAGVIAPIVTAYLVA